MGLVGKKIFTPEQSIKTYEATITALNIIDGEFTLNSLIDAANELIQADGLDINYKTTFSRIQALVKSGHIEVINAHTKPKVFRLVKKVESTSAKPKRKYKKRVKITGKGVPDISEATPKQIAAFLLTYMTEVMGITGSIEDLKAMKQDANIVHSLQERISDMVKTNNALRIELDKTKKDNTSIAVLKERYQELAKKHDAAVNKLEKFKRLSGSI